MGAVDKIINALKINTEMVDDYDYYDDDENEVEYSDRKESYDEKPKKASRVTPFATKSKKSSNYGMEIKSIQPLTIEEASLITDELLEKNSVIINLTGADVANARQILDFTSGSVYALQGTLKKITDSIFVAVPLGVNIDGTFSDKAE